MFLLSNCLNKQYELIYLLTYVALHKCTLGNPVGSILIS